MRVQSFLTPKNLPTITKVLTWTAPAIAIPALRYTQDTRQQRKEMFIRDASTYTLGALLFLGAEWLTKTILDKKKIFKTVESRNLTAFLVGLTLNLLYAGIGAVRLSKAFSKPQAQNKTGVAPFTLPSPPLFTPLINANSLPVIPAYAQPNTRMPHLA